MTQYFLAVPILAYIPCMLPIFINRLSIQRRTLLILGAFVLHLIVVILNVVISPLLWLSSPALTLSMISALLTFSLIGLRSYRPKLAALDKVIIPISAFMLLIATLAPTTTAGLSVESWTLVHLMCILFGFIGFALAFAFSALYLLQRQRLKQKKFTQLSKSPSLSILDSYNKNAIVAGFICLSLGALMGVVWTRDAQQALEFDWTIAATGILWLWYAAAIYVRFNHGRQGRWAAWFSVLGFSTVCVLILSGSVITGDWHLGGGP